MQPAMAEPVRRSSLWPLLATIAGIGITVALGTWQLGRAQEKRELKARLDALAAGPAVRVPGAEIAAGDVELRRVEARGVFEPRHTVYLDNRIHHGRPGYHVVTPLRIEDSIRYVLVNRGWIAAGAERARLPDVSTPPGLVAVSGTAVVPGKRILELSESVIEGEVWQNLTIERYRAARPLAIQPFVILQQSPLPDGLTRDWPAPDVGIDKHYGYAFQWFALAATLLIFYAVTRYRRRQRA
jgi:surfeit locus 1 family protein